MKLATLLGTLLFTAVVAQEPRDVSCPAPFILLGDTCYSVSTEKMTWDDARNFCLYEGPVGHISDLAQLDDCGQLGHLWNYIKYDLGREEDYWIGGSIRDGETDWKWLTGHPVEMGVPFWYPEEPDGGLDEDALMLSKVGLFADGKKDVQLAFVCQIFHL